MPVSHRSFESYGLHRMTPAQQLRAPRLPLRLLWLYTGLTFFGFSLAMIIESTLGMPPWDVLHFGLSVQWPITIGQALIATSMVVLLFWIPLREMPGVGTISNGIYVGFVLDASLAVLPVVDHLAARIGLLVAGILLNAAATAMYIGAQLGPGPRDGLMTGLARRLPVSVRVIRTCLEVIVVVIGFSLGGIVGVGTVLFALSIGPLTQLFLPHLVIRLPKPPPSSADPLPPTPA